jgi:hypothetical protein
MATKSFHENLDIRTEEEARILIRAFDEADRRPPSPPAMRIEELIRAGERWVDEGGLDRLIARLERELAEEMES